MKLKQTLSVFSLFLFLSICACNRGTQPATTSTETPPTDGPVLLEGTPTNRYMEDRIDLLLVEGITPESMERKYAGYGLKEHSPSSRSQNRWLFTFNPQKITNLQMLKMCNQSEDILEAKLIPKN